ncbi:MAG: ribosomal L7Ae/L30e/S12e/Gadd45 family protein [Clostridia bacterium]|nr:ribosomal L7Ae/L30e/S12e/Gadd45 family protein [Clostridia bacterium]
MKDPDGPSRRVVGTKQVLRALKCNQVEKVYIASDADESVKLSVIDFCSKLKIVTEEVNTMHELGCEFGISVGAATAAILKENNSQ